MGRRSKITKAQRKAAWLARRELLLRVELMKSLTKAADEEADHFRAMTWHMSLPGIEDLIARRPRL